ncbi:MAG: hypothetical protein EBQ92_09980 [Proteobacteria bacterium]|nr:hypothetical protein [Pseudomonadota bacterium]
MKKSAIVLVLMFFCVAKIGLAGSPGLHAPKTPSAREGGRPEERGAIEQAGEPIEIPEDITTVESLRKWLQKFPEEEVVIKMGATWCGPCRDLHPEIEKLAKRKVGELKVLTIDIDNNPALAKILSPRGIVPSLVTLKNDGKSSPSQPIIGYKVNQSSPIGNWLKTK